VQHPLNQRVHHLGRREGKIGVRKT